MMTPMTGGSGFDVAASYIVIVPFPLFATYRTCKELARGEIHPTRGRCTCVACIGKGVRAGVGAGIASVVAAHDPMKAKRTARERLCTSAPHEGERDDKRRPPLEAPHVSLPVF